MRKIIFKRGERGVVNIGNIVMIGPVSFHDVPNLLTQQVKSHCSRS